MKELVYRVDSVRIAPMENDPARLRITAGGVVRGGGHAHAQLIPAGPHPPDGGIWDFDFVTEPPRRPSSAALVPVEAGLAWHPGPVGVTGVRVRGETNSLAALRRRVRFIPRCGPPAAGAG